MSTLYEETIGLETHVQLKTRSKLFCGCGTSFGAPPNSQVCPVCLGYPGALPVLNAEAIRLTVRTGLLLGCAINPRSKFDRKSYFYPDMPKNYQISQYDEPLCLEGRVVIETSTGPRVIRLNRIHLEEDVAKSTHFGGSSGVDFNRAGTPLMEIVTEPDLHSADEAQAYLLALKRILEYGQVSDCNLEEGNIRCDVNISVRPEGRAKLGVKTELKNMNTFKGVHRAAVYEIRRQIEVLERGGAIRQETRRWDDARGVTESMRAKEYAHDYRYFPEPDLMPVVLDEATLDEWRAALPELPAARRQRFESAYELSAYDADVLAADQALADYFEAVVQAGAPPKAAANWVMTEVLRACSEAQIAVADFTVPPAQLAALIGLVTQGQLNAPAAKQVFGILCAAGGDPAEIMRARGLAQVSDASALTPLVAQAIAEHPQSVAAYQGGKPAALQHLIGQVMRLSRGKADPQQVRQMLLESLGAVSSEQ